MEQGTTLGKPFGATDQENNRQTSQKCYRVFRHHDSPPLDFIDATIHFEPLPRLPATPTMLIRANIIERFFDGRRGRRCAGQAQMLLAAQ
jgi:hypothetical protein